MLTDTIHYLDTISEILRDPQYAALDGILNAIVNKKVEIETNLLRDVNYGIKGNEYRTNIAKIIDRAVRAFSIYDVSLLLAKIDQVSESVRAIVPEDAIQIVMRVKGKAVEAIKAIESYKLAGGRDIQSVHATLEELLNANAELRGYRASLNLFGTLLATGAQPSEGEIAVEMSFAPYDTGLEEFSRLLKLLINTYAFACLVFDVSPTAHPLRLRDIYSGSIHISLLGEQKAINLAADIVSAAARFLSENFSSSGKFKRLSGQLGDVLAHLDLVKRLQDQGLDVSDLSEILRNSAVLLAKELEAVILNQRRVAIDGRIIEVVPTPEKALEYQTKLLPGSNLDTQA